MGKITEREIEGIRKMVEEEFPDDPASRLPHLF
ncbi:hypothetical protein HKBW3S06_00870 [Candidatus Hakubella thermalkaliphila]|uniref:Uncharacterized protein n=1 Tax=Candidatus Hakubella thermalkaliphila TaxID=2754717 RepID=A0A6V8NNF8_9ACTN|nr:hypothetical protein HKBW3S06_00870 [Candidatus Hakubella thermalkaliphila]